MTDVTNDNPGVGHYQINKMKSDSILSKRSPCIYIYSI